MTKILVVDDVFEDLNTIKKALTKAGYEAVTATNGAQAMEFIESDEFNAILIDIRMPTLSGYDLLRLLRERLNHNTKMIYISIVPKREVDMNDIDGFIQKPSSDEIVLKTVKDVLKKKK